MGVVLKKVFRDGGHLAKPDSQLVQSGIAEISAGPQSLLHESPHMRKP